jgi:hypothetical protein
MSPTFYVIWGIVKLGLILLAIKLVAKWVGKVMDSFRDMR